ncbi:repressor LexA, partial [Streptomyces sp. SID7982]|nr:repressor LexA [Streptomyces sp. SID7982]
MTTTADSATITTRDHRSQSRLEPVHAMNDSVTNTDGPEPARPGRSMPGRPPGIRADSSGLTDRQRRVIEVIRDSVQR